MADKILAIWMFAIGLQLFLHYLIFFQDFQSYPKIGLVLAPLPLVHGPFLIVYVKTLIARDGRLNKVLWINFLPALIYFLSLSPKFFWTNEALYQYAFVEIREQTPWHTQLAVWAVDISGIAYAIWSLYVLRGHRRNLVTHFSYSDDINLRWLRNVTIGVLIIWSGIAISTPNNLVTEGSLVNSDIVYTLVTLFVFMIGYYGIRQTAIFKDFDDNPELAASGQGEKYAKSTLRQDKVQEHVDRLLSYMQEAKPYLQSRLTLPELAQSVGLNQNHLSQIINERLDTNFHDFVNQYRLDEFKHRLAKEDSHSMTLLGHALESGFNSKSSFNEVFKKLTGTTPSRYHKEQQSRQNEKHPGQD